MEHINPLDFDFAPILTRNGQIPDEVKVTFEIDEFEVRVSILAAYPCKEQIQFYFCLAITQGGELFMTQSTVVPLFSASARTSN